MYEIYTTGPNECVQIVRAQGLSRKLSLLLGDVAAIISPDNSPKPSSVLHKTKQLRFAIGELLARIDELEAPARERAQC